MSYLVGSSSKAIAYFDVGDKTVCLELPFRSESINPRGSSFTSEAILGNRAVKGATITARTYQGSIDLEIFDLTTNSPAAKHALLGALMYLVLGGYSSGTVSLSSTVPKLKYLEIQHGSSASALKWSDLFVTGLSLRFPSDGVPTATLDVLAKSTVTSSAPSANVTYTSFLYESYYTPKDLKLKIGTSEVTSFIRNLELSFSLNTLQASAWGSLDVADISSGMLDMAQVTVEFYISSMTSAPFNTFKATYDSGSMSTTELTVLISSPTQASNVAELKFSGYYVTEMSHDISGNDYIVCRATLQVPAEKITLSGVDFGLSS